MYPGPTEFPQASFAWAYYLKLSDSFLIFGLSVSFLIFFVLSPLPIYVSVRVSLYTSLFLSLCTSDSLFSCLAFMCAMATLLSKIKYTRMRRARIDTHAHASKKEKRETEETLNQERQRNTPLIERELQDWMVLEVTTVCLSWIWFSVSCCVSCCHLLSILILFRLGDEKSSTNQK